MCTTDKIKAKDDSDAPIAAAYGKPTCGTTVKLEIFDDTACSNAISGLSTADAALVTGLDITAGGDYKTADGKSCYKLTYVEPAAAKTAAAALKLKTDAEAYFKENCGFDKVETFAKEDCTGDATEVKGDDLKAVNAYFNKFVLKTGDTPKYKAVGPKGCDTATVKTADD